MIVAWDHYTHDWTNLGVLCFSVKKWYHLTGSHLILMNTCLINTLQLWRVITHLTIKFLNRFKKKFWQLNINNKNAGSTVRILFTYWFCSCEKIWRPNIPPKWFNVPNIEALASSVVVVHLTEWLTMFIFALTPGNFPAISDDLVNSYHLLLCCLDLVFANIVLANRRDLLNPDFSGELRVILV